jgi:hypothetical protein
MGKRSGRAAYGTLDGLTGYLRIARSIRGRLTAAGMPRSSAVHLIKVIAGFCLLTYMAEQGTPDLAEVNRMFGAYLEAGWSWVEALQFFADSKSHAPIAEHAELIKRITGVAKWHVTYLAIAERSDTVPLVHEFISRFSDVQRVRSTRPRM